MNLAAEFDWYVAEVLSLGPAGEPVPVPTQPRPLPPLTVRAVLDHPAVLFSQPTEASEPRHRMQRLMRFALWLEHAAAAGDLPAELASRAARYRFLVWSLPARLPAEHEVELCPETVSWPSPTGSLTETSDDRLRERARAARDDWLRLLAAAEDDPWLAALQARGDPLVERDLHWLTRAWPQRRRGQRRGEAPRPASARLDLSNSGTSSRERRGEHRRVAAEVAETHWLPRGSILHAAVSFGLRWWARAGALAAFPAASAAVLALVLARHGDLARWSALAVLALAGLVVAFGLPPRTDAGALLRIPAAAAAGQALLLSLTPRWWLSPNGWLVGAAMLAAVACYVAVEARLHGTERWPAAQRALLLTAIGALYSFVLSVIFLGFVVPAMGEQGRCIDGWWRSAPLGPMQLDEYCANQLGQSATAWPAGVLLLMTGWSLAVGVAAQILWDDRPLTAPLGRLRRVRGTRP